MSISLSNTKPLVNLSDEETKHTINAFLKYVAVVHDVEICAPFYVDAWEGDQMREVSNDRCEELLADFLSQEGGKDLWCGRHPEDEKTWQNRQSLPGAGEDE